MSHQFTISSLENYSIKGGNCFYISAQKDNVCVKVKDIHFVQWCVLYIDWFQFQLISRIFLKHWHGSKIPRQSAYFLHFYSAKAIYISNEGNHNWEIMRVLLFYMFWHDLTCFKLFLTLAVLISYPSKLAK